MEKQPKLRCVLCESPEGDLMCDVEIIGDLDTPLLTLSKGDRYCNVCDECYKALSQLGMI